MPQDRKSISSINTVMTAGTITDSIQASSQQQDQTIIEPPPRLSNTTVCVPIVYGSIAFPLKKLDSNNNTHQWTLYLRGPNNEDLSSGIAKVVFNLHPSFSQPIRELTAPPFEVTERGWGEFEATIRIVWRDVGEKAIVLLHAIKLYPPLALNALPDPAKDNDPVISEKYDEVVFTDPTETFHKQLMESGNLPKIKSHEDAVQALFKSYSDSNDFNTLLEAQKFLESELVSVKDRILRADSALVELDEALAAVAAIKNKPIPKNSATSVATTTAGSSTTANKSHDAVTSNSASNAGTKRKSSSKSGGTSKKKVNSNK